jgi:hypothetical protein
MMAWPGRQAGSFGLICAIREDWGGDFLPGSGFYHLGIVITGMKCCMHSSPGYLPILLINLHFYYILHGESKTGQINLQRGESSIPVLITCGPSLVPLHLFMYSAPSRTFFRG